MHDLQSQLLAFREEPTLWIGVGNSDHADDAVGLHLAQLLSRSGVPHVVGAGTNPERRIASMDLARYDHVVFLDAVELGADPGSVVLLTAGEMVARFPQISTHKLSLGLLARYIESQSNARAWLLGIQPQSLGGRRSEVGGRWSEYGHWLSATGDAHDDSPGPLSPPLRLTVALLHRLIIRSLVPALSTPHVSR